MAIFSHFTEKVPGSYRAKTSEFGQKWPKSLKRPKSPFLGIPAFPAGVVLHQPLAAGPCPRFRDLLKKGGFLTSRGTRAGLSGGLSGTLRTPGPRDGDRAPARGVDVKPHTRDRLSPGTGVPRPPQAPEGPPDQVRDQDPGSREPGSSSPPGTRRLREVPEGPLARPGPPGGGCFTSTPRGGALSPAGVRSPGTARRDKSLQAAAGLERAG